MGNSRRICDQGNGLFRNILGVLCIMIFVTVASSASAASVQVARTGQTTCSDTTGVTISCGGTGQDGALQAGVAWPAPRFASYSSGVQSVNDRLTGLMWAKDGNAAGGTKCHSL